MVLQELVYESEHIFLQNKKNPSQAQVSDQDAA